MTTMTSSDRREKIWAVVRVASGDFLEMYDFFVFGYYATAIGRAFFPTGSEFAQLMLAFMTFGAGFLMRPLGGRGHLSDPRDRQSRRRRRVADVCCRVRRGGNAVGVPYRLGSQVEIRGSGSLDRAGPLRPPRPLPVVIFFLRRIFRLTRVTRIFQKSIFTRTAPRRPGGTPRRAFCCADATRPRAAYSFASRQRRESHAVSKRRKRKSGRPAARGAQPDDDPVAKPVGGR